MSFTINDGQIMGDWSNGAGKTTTFRLILDFLKADQGKYCGMATKLVKKNTILLVICQKSGLFPKVTIEDQLIYFARLRGKKKEDILQKSTIGWTNLKSKARKPIKSNRYQRKSKVQLISTLIHEPKLVILDEPFSGLDPMKLLKNGIIELKKMAHVSFSPVIIWIMWKKSAITWLCCGMVKPS